MQKPVFSALAISLTCGLLAAQTGPGISRTAANSVGLKNGTGTNDIPGTSLIQVSAFQLPGDPPGTWTMCFTVRALPTAFGGKGGDDVVMGKWNRVTGKFTPRNYTAGLNTQGNEFGLMLDTSGRYALLDHPDGVYFAQRAAPNRPFGQAVQVQGMGTIIVPTYVDPAPVYVGGTTANDLHMLWVNQGRIVLQKLDISNPAAPRVSGNAKIVVNAQAGFGPHSPMPLHGPDGTVKGLWHAANMGGDSDMQWSSDLDPMTPFQQVVDSTNWLNNGAVAGGLLVWRDTAVTNMPQDVGAAWMLGDEKKPGQNASIFGGAFRSTAAPAITTIFASVGTIAGVSIPGINGKLALNPAALIPFASYTHASANERGSITFPLPNIPSLSGVKLVLQGLTIDAGKLTFTNDAALKIL